MKIHIAGTHERERENLHRWQARVFSVVVAAFYPDLPGGFNIFQDKAKLAGSFVSGICALVNGVSGNTVSGCGRTGIPDEVYGNSVFPCGKRSGILMPVSWYDWYAQEAYCFRFVPIHFTSRRKERVMSGRDASGSCRAAMNMALISRGKAHLERGIGW